MLAVLHGLLAGMRANAAWATVLNGLLAVVVLLVTVDVSGFLEMRCLSTG